MKKQTIILVNVFLTACFVYTGMFIGFEQENKWVITGLSVGILLLSIILFQMGKKNNFLYYISNSLNSFATGLVISIYYIHYDITLNMNSLLFVITSLFIVINVISIIPNSRIMKNKTKLKSFLIILTGYMVTIPLWIIYDNPIYSLLFFLLHILYFYIIAIKIVNSDNLLRTISLSTFGMFALVTYAVIIVVSEGEALEGVFSIGSGDTNNNQNSIKI